MQVLTQLVQMGFSLGKVLLALRACDNSQVRRARGRHTVAVARPAHCLPACRPRRPREQSCELSTWRACWRAQERTCAWLFKDIQSKTEASARDRACLPMQPSPFSERHNYGLSFI